MRLEWSCRFAADGLESIFAALNCRGQAIGGSAGCRNSVKMPRFSIKLLLILTALAAVALTGWRIYSEPYRRAELALYELHRCRASVSCVRFELPWWQSWLLRRSHHAQIVAVRSHGMHSGNHFVSMEMPLNHDLDDRTLRACGLVDSIKAIWLYHTKITSDGLKYLADKQQLRELYVDNTAVDDRGLRHLANLPQLKKLGLGQTQVTDAGLAVLSNFPELTALRISSPHLSDACAAQVRGLKHLYELSIGGPEITDAFLEQIRDLKSVVRLHIVGTQITGRGLRHLKNWKKLEELELGYNHIGDEGLDTLADLPELYYLSLSEPDVTGDGIAALRKNKRLKTFYSNDSGESEAGRKRRATFWAQE
jgi:hypothetical protein